MATVVTRSLALTDRFDKIAIRVQSEDYADKFGALVLTLTSISWTSGTNISIDTGLVNLYPPMDSENRLLNNYNLTTTVGTFNITKKYVTSYNNGIPGPSARRNPDGSWDLLELSFEMPEDN